MNRKQTIMIIAAVMLFAGAGTVLAFNLKTKPSLGNSSSSDDGSDNGIINKKTTNGTEYQTSSEAPSTKSKGSSTQTLSATPTTNPTSPTVTNTYTPPVTPTCPDYLRDSYTESYNASTNAENINYQNNKDSIKAYWNSRGMLYSGAAEAALAAEDQRHQTALSTIDINYQQQLAKSNCT